MYVCLCYSVTDARVRDAIAEGARDVAELGRRTGAGTDCGGCRETLEGLIARYSEPVATGLPPQQGRT